MEKPVLHQLSALRRLRQLIDRWQQRPHRRGRVYRLRQRAARLAQQLLDLPAVRRAPATLALIGTLGFGTVQAQTSFATALVDPFGLVEQQDIVLPQLADLDNDGDLDILASGYDDDTEQSRTLYFENVGTATAPSFAAPVLDPFGLDALPSEQDLVVFSLVDLDGDGDLDILGGSYENFIYLPNNGTAAAPSFGEAVLNPFGLENALSDDDDYLFPATADLDGDGDFDLLLGGYYGNFFVENTGTATAPAFGMAVNNPFNINPGPEEGYFLNTLADFDLDGDVDLVTGSYYSTLEYFENTGTSADADFAAPIDDLFTFTPGDEGGIIIPTSGDLDGDGDVDLLAIDYNYGGSWLFFENTSQPVRTTELPEDFSFEYGPVPATEQLTVRTNYDLEELRLENALGQLLQTHRGNVRQISLDGLRSGVYYLRAVLPDGRFGTYKVVVK